MTWHRSDLTAAGAGRALHYGHPDHIPRWTLTPAVEVGRYVLGSSEGAAVTIDLRELATWTGVKVGPAEADLLWVEGSMSSEGGLR